MSKYYYINRYGNKTEINLHYRSIMPRIAICSEVKTDTPVQIHESGIITEEDETKKEAEK